MNQVIVKNSKSELLNWSGDKLRKLRESKGLTLQQVADHLDMLKPSYMAHEDRRCQTSIFMLCKICQLYEITIIQFFEDIPFNFYEG